MKFLSCVKSKGGATLRFECGQKSCSISVSDHVITCSDADGSASGVVDDMLYDTNRCNARLVDGILYVMFLARKRYTIEVKSV